jgi:hypothetical protein
VAAPRCRDCGGLKWTPDGRCARCQSFPTLGYDVAQLIESKCAIPDGEHAGEPYVLTDEQLRFLLHFYRVNPHAKRVKVAGHYVWRNAFVYFRGAQLVRPQKWGKGPFAAAWICAEADSEGPVLFDGWDANGEPVGKPWATPWIQVTAVSEDQTANVWRALVPMIELGAIHADIPDTGQTRINLPGGGRIEPVTSSARSRLGQRLTGALQDEAHSWLERNGGRLLADNQRRNLAGMGGRFLETGNAWDPREESVAQQTAESTAPGVYHDDVDPGAGSVRNKADRRKMLKKVYGDAWWVDLDRIDGEIVALLAKGDAAQAERFFLNRKLAGEDAAFPPGLVDRNIVPGRKEADPKSLITIGVDGARFVDAIAVVATDVRSGFQWPLGVWERPEHAPDDYEHPFHEVDGAMTEAFDRFRVWRVYVDPQYIDPLLEKWQGRWGEKVVMPWYTNRPKQVAWAVRGFIDAAGAEDWTHNGNATFVRHLKNARKYPLNVYDDKHRQMYSLSKDRPDSPRKIDAAMAAVLSWEARSDAIAGGAELDEPVYRTAGFH